MEFKVGNITRGLKNGYGITNENMLEGIVEEINNYRKTMLVKVLKYTDESFIGDKYWVDNTCTKFAIIHRKITKQELVDAPLGTIIITDKENNNVFVKVGKDDWCNESCDHLSEKYFEEDLSINSHSNIFGKKILEVKEPDYIEIYNFAKEPKEMTIAEIEKVLGHAVKIVKEEN